MRALVDCQIECRGKGLTRRGAPRVELSCVGRERWQRARRCERPQHHQCDRPLLVVAPRGLCGAARGRLGARESALSGVGTLGEEAHHDARVDGLAAKAAERLGDRDDPIAQQALAARRRPRRARMALNHEHLPGALRPRALSVVAAD